MSRIVKRYIVPAGTVTTCPYTHRKIEGPCQVSEFHYSDGGVDVEVDDLNYVKNTVKVKVNLESDPPVLDYIR